MKDQTIHVENISVEIIVDDYAESPREWCNATKFVMFHKRLNLPNELGIKNEDYGSWDEMQEALDNQYKWVYPVFMYDHGGLAFSINSFDCKWDSGQVGFIVSDEGTPEEAYKWAKSELETYGQYVNGEVYGVRVFEDTEEIDSSYEYYASYGYYGYDHEASGLKDELDSYLTRVTTEEIRQQILDKLS
jgi:hypothetical protein